VVGAKRFLCAKSGIWSKSGKRSKHHHLAEQERGSNMKQRALALAMKRIILAELALSMALTVPVFAQSRPPATVNVPADDGTGGASPSNTQQADASISDASTTAPSSSNATQLDQVQVTGSLIRSSDKVGFNQVQTVTAQQIQDSGSTTVADFLRQTSANSGSSYSESTVLNQSAGAAGIALRGLSVKYTLVLVDGQRAAPYAFASGGTDTLVDLNTLPLNMIDRIEIVKTGAVSQYGSDAIAGVVNIITKKDFQGVQLDGNVGGAQHGGQGTANVSLLGGFGDLNKDRYNVTAALSFYRTSGVSMAERSITSNENYLGLNGGFFAQPSSFFMTPTGPEALSPCGPTGTVTSAQNNLQTKAPGTVCSQNGANGQAIAASLRRSNLKVHADVKLSDYNEAFVDVWGSYNTTALPSGLAGFGAGALVPSLYYAPGSGFNAFAPAVGGNALTYYFPDSQVVNTTSRFYRVLAGVKGSFGTKSLGDWDWSASYGHSESDVSNTYTNQVNASVVTNYLGGMTPDTFSATALNNLPGVLGNSHDGAVSKLDTLEATISTSNLFTLPAGDIGFGFGTQFQHQSEYIGPGSLDFVNPYTQAVSGQRNAGAVYYQIDIPILQSLTLSQSSRYDHYNDFGGVYSPRIALRYQPFQALTLYASYDRGFRAPTLIELDEKGSVTYQAVGTQNINEYFVGNPHLQPEHTQNYNVGFQLSPSSNTDIGFDWYKINVSKVIAQPNIVTLVNANPGQPFYVLGYANLAYLHTDGFEATFKQGLPTSIGNFSLQGDWAYVWHFAMPNSGAVNDFAGNNGANDTVFGGALPRWKGNTSLSWTAGNWGTTLSWQYTGRYKQVIVAGSNAASYSLFNLSVNYTGFKNLTLYASIDNLFNRAPPYDPVWTYTYRGYYDPSLYTYIGRYAQVGATYRF
jgi:iron complex outermembrane recepter protein